ncbi:hypothetical protein TBLA_0H01640 [Henningerozyma blattae CBS 6284]|uniref:Uncharacterized protein n=1 Tax=Henningerozyma blattae (strain ATCC 34711 / CBS 6284 / DSM 70876 / NBRC 10599 / NRRL Y-10934 / UCD 77-7) TaxID=1071380 RepID=I2H7U9_HENB6|nr:hypothetical protein TBLA_0H01640 [Tetrapisispora blattae CBS 6284]CCH62451.1 hypothetical protein TBLA_0H01640 [Tetrapisispora blattae CBS 6284]
MTECINSIWPLISRACSTVTFLTSFVSLFPQLWETYRDKSVEGLSPYFIICWLMADITTLYGAQLTGQMKFQVWLAIYFLCNDLCMLSQYWYYGILHGNRLAKSESESSGLCEGSAANNSGLAYGSLGLHDEENIGHVRNEAGGGIIQPMLAGALLAANATAAAIQSHPEFTNPGLAPPPGEGFPGSPGMPSSRAGRILAWAGALLYVGARVPQLIRNYRRQSTDGVSPGLFAATLAGNFAYAGGIVTGCPFLTSPDRGEYLKEALPFVVGSLGTVLFDVIYFYQHFVLYAQGKGERTLGVI